MRHAIVPALVLVVLASGCYATLRPDARLRPGFEVAAQVGLIVSPSGHTVTCDTACTEGTRDTRRSEWLYQLHLQYAWGSRPGGAALALAVEVPLSLARPYLDSGSTVGDVLGPARLDAFAALCHRGDWHCGAGLEVSKVPGAYLVITRVLGRGSAMSLTGRYLRNLGKHAPVDDQAVQVQLAFSLRALGLAGSLFGSYTFANGLGVDLGDPETGGAHRHEDWGRHLVIGGLTLAY